MADTQEARDDLLLRDLAHGTMAASCMRFSWILIGMVNLPFQRAADARQLFCRPAAGLGDLPHRLEELAPGPGRGRARPLASGGRGTAAAGRRVEPEKSGVQTAP